MEGAGRSWEPGGTAGAVVTRNTPCLPHTPPAGCSPPTPREDRDRLETKVYQVPDSIDDVIGRYKLAAMNLSIDELTEEQKAYLSGWAVD